MIHCRSCLNETYQHRLPNVYQDRPLFLKEQTPVESSRKNIRPILKPARIKIADISILPAQRCMATCRSFCNRGDPLIDDNSYRHKNRALTTTLKVTDNQSNNGFSKHKSEHGISFATQTFHRFKANSPVFPNKSHEILSEVQSVTANKTSERTSLETVDIKFTQIESGSIMKADSLLSQVAIWSDQTEYPHLELSNAGNSDGVPFELLMNKRKSKVNIVLPETFSSGVILDETDPCANTMITDDFDCGNTETGVLLNLLGQLPGEIPFFTNDFDKDKTKEAVSPSEDQPASRLCAKRQHSESRNTKKLTETRHFPSLQAIGSRARRIVKAESCVKPRHKSGLSEDDVRTGATCESDLVGVEEGIKGLSLDCPER